MCIYRQYWRIFIIVDYSGFFAYTTQLSLLSDLFFGNRSEELTLRDNNVTFDPSLWISLPWRTPEPVDKTSPNTS